MKKHKKIIQFIVAIVLVWALIIKVNWQEVWQLIHGADVMYVFLFIVFYVSGIFVSAKKWQVLGEFASFSHTYSFYFKNYFVGTFLNNFFPSFIGGDAYRTVMLGKKDQKISKASTTVVMDRISGLLVILFLAIFFFGFSGRVFTPEVSIAFFGFLAIIFVIVVVHARAITRFLSRIATVPKVVNKYIQNFTVFNRKDVLTPIVGYSTIFAFAGIAVANYMLFIALGAEISVMKYMSVIFMTNIIASLPLSIGNIGTKEWAYIALFGIFGIGSSTLVTIVLISRIMQMFVSFFAVPIYLSSKK